MRGNRKKKMWLGGALALANTGLQFYQQHQQKKAGQQQQLADQREAQLATAQQQMSNLPPPVAYTPTFAKGGNISTMDNNKYVDYSEGQSHAGPDGGIPVDQQGQPTALSGGAEVALTEKGEVTFNSYVFSNEIKIPGNKKITFADEAKRIKKKHEFYLGKKLDKKEPISRKALERELEQLMMIQETIKGNTVTQEEADMQAQMAAEQAMIEQGQMGGMEQPLPPGVEGMGMDMGMGQEELPMMEEGGGLGLKTRPVSLNMFEPTKTPSLGVTLNMPNNLFPSSDGELNQSAGNPDDGWGEYSGGVPWQSMIPGAATSVLQMGLGLAMNRPRKIDNLRLGRMGYRDISLAPERTRALSEGRIARSTMNRNLSRRGDLSSAGILAGQHAASAEVNRNVGAQLGALSTQEATANQQGRMAVDQTNLQLAGQERMFNTQAKMAERHRRADTNAAIVSSGVTNLATTVQNRQDQDRHSRQFAAMMGMMQPDYRLMSKGKGRHQRFKTVHRGNTTIG